MRLRPVWPIVLFLMTANWSAAVAQVVDRPPRQLGGLFGGHQAPDPNHTSQVLALTFNLGSGYDTTVGPDGAPIGTINPSEEGFATTGDVAARFWRGRTSNFIEVSGGGFVNQLYTANTRVKGGDANVRGETGLGRRSGIGFDGGAAYQPTVLFSALGPLVGPNAESVVPDGNAPQGILEQQWLTARGAVTAYRHWTTRQRMDVLYGRSMRDPRTGPGTNSRTQVASARHRWNPRPNGGFQFSYRYDENQQTDQTLEREPVRTHTIDAGVQFERRIAPTRGALFSFNGGASYARVRPIGAPDIDGELGALRTYWVPIVAATARLDLARYWNVSTGFDRTVTVLEGLSPEPFATNVASLRVDGVMAQRINVGVSGAISRGAALVTETGSFRATGATAQVQYAMAQWCGVFVGYNFYKHQLLEVPAAPTGYPARYNRHSVRVGFSFWLPLYGTV